MKLLGNMTVQKLQEALENGEDLGHLGAAFQDTIKEVVESLKSGGGGGPGVGRNLRRRLGVTLDEDSVKIYEFIESACPAGVGGNVGNGTNGTEPPPSPLVFTGYAQLPPSEDDAKLAPPQSPPPGSNGTGVPPEEGDNGPPPGGNGTGVPPEEGGSGPSPGANGTGIPPAEGDNGPPPGANGTGIPPAEGDSGPPPGGNGTGTPPAPPPQGGNGTIPGNGSDAPLIDNKSLGGNSEPIPEAGGIQSITPSPLNQVSTTQNPLTQHCFLTNKAHHVSPLAI